MRTGQDARIFVFAAAQRTGMHGFLLAGRWRRAAHCNGTSADVIQAARVARRATHDGFVRRTKTVRVGRRRVIAGNARHLAVVSLLIH